MNAEPFNQLLDAIDAYAGELEAIGALPPPAPRWRQDWFPRLDAAAAYAMVRHVKPRRIVEVGSGHSTRFLARAVADGGLDTRITAIDPQPRASIQKLKVKWVPAKVEHAGIQAFAGLAKGDIVFIDSSHKLAPGSDVEFLVNKVLPQLPAGTYVHFHDIFLPDDYPESWAWRRYNEQVAVAALLQRKQFVAQFASHWIATRRPERLSRGVLGKLPLMAGAFESSLWLRKHAS
ncbi:MAG: class I SAM-dependent methyltransferase [Pseudomonadota bacterium]|nr:class I SAM-dependent methyltransferase [Pseudomonadota bacterium]